MKITIAVDAIDNFKNLLESNGRQDLARSLGFARGRSISDKILFDLNGANLDLLNALAEGASQAKERSLVLQLNALKAIFQNPSESKISTVHQFKDALSLYLIRDRINGWVFMRGADGALRPYLVTDIIERMAPRSDEEDKVLVNLRANVGKLDRESSSLSSSQTTLYFSKDDFYKKTVAEALQAIGVFKESAELIAAYREDVERFDRFRGTTGSQFRAHGRIYMTGDWSTRGIIEVDGDCFVNDEAVVERVIAEDLPVKFLSDGEDDVTSEVPVHCDLYMFHLSLHKYFWVHVSVLTPYVYRAELREKIVLDEAHRDLIDVLTDDLDVVMDDIIQGKGGGTTILCRGLPGLGKTLTAEVYSEVTQRPLYRVHSGQLGTNAEVVEKQLTGILRRAERWKCVLLLDEADVFVRRRDNDIDHNAVVAVFLRTLEYFSGLLFMTTNRLEDIDDAIISRCIAIVNYEMPKDPARRQMWEILTEQFGNRLPDGLITELVAAFPNVSGRDIKELTKLTFRYCAKKAIPITLDTFRRCALFKGFN